jgi:hypothetical protein
MRVLAGTGWHQESQSLAAGTWTEVFPANQDRSWVSIQNTGSKPVYLHIGDPGVGAAVDGTVGFRCLKAACNPYSKWVCGDMDAVCRGPVYALAVGAGGSTIQVGEF